MEAASYFGKELKKNDLFDAQMDLAAVKSMESAIAKEIQMRKLNGDKYNIYLRLKNSGKLDIVMDEFIHKHAEKIMESEGHKKLEQLLQKDKEEYEKK